MKKLKSKKFGKRSLQNLSTCHPDLIKIANLSLSKMKDIDFTIICGKRSLEDQKAAVKSGYSKTMKSKHLESPSRAFDYIPYPFYGDWNDSRFITIAEILLESAKELGILARWGGDWNMNGEYKDERFFDSGHFELLTQDEYNYIKNRKK